jgi:site-specific recombinase XerD
MPLPGKPRADVYSLPWTAFPASLHADLQAWLDRLACAAVDVDLDGDLVDGPSDPLRPATLKHREYQVRQFASALVKQGVDPSSLHRLADLVHLPTLRLGIRFYRERHDGKFPPSLPGLLDALRSIARYWVKAPAADLRQLQLLIKAIRKKAPRYEEMTAKNLTRLHPILDDEAAAVMLLRLPKRLLQLAEEAQQPQQAFLLMQRALAIEILLKLPLRISNLAELDIKRHLSLSRHPAGVCRIILAAYEIKNDNPINSPLSKFTCTLLRRYLNEFRPGRTEPASTALFPGQFGKTKNPQAFGRQISKAVFEYTGLTMHPHLFRHAMVSLYLKLRPGDKETVRLVLGHKSVATVNKSYAFTDRDAAVRRFWQVLEEHLNKAAP